MKPLDMSKFKKISSTNTHSVFSHPDGHMIKVSHKNLPAEEELKLRKMAEGGSVEAEEKHPYDPGPGTMGEKVAGATEGLMPVIQHPQTEPMAASSQQPLPEENVPPTAQLNQTQPNPGAQNPIQAQAQSQLAMEGMGMQAGMQGIQQQQQAGEQAARAEKDVNRQSVIAQQQQAQDYQTHLADLNKEHYNFQQDLMNGHINPTRYMDNMSTGKRILTGIGLILGGMGGGMTGQGNPAVDFLQHNIDRDIEAQKAELGKKENLLSANLRQYGNINTAADVTRLQTANIMAAKLAEGMAQAKSTQAKATAASATSELLSRYANVLPQAAARQAMFGAQGANSPAPEQVADLVVPEKQKEKVSESLGQIRQLEALRNDLHGANDKLQGMVGRGVLSPNQRESLINTYAGKLGKASAGRYNAQEAKQQVEALLYGKTDISPETRSLKDANLDNFIDTMRAEHDSRLAPYRPYGVGVPSGHKVKKMTNMMKR